MSGLIKYRFATFELDLKARELTPGAKDTRGVELDHAFSERTTFVITPDHKIAATFSSADDGIKPVAAQKHIDGGRPLVGVQTELAVVFV